MVNLICPHCNGKGHRSGFAGYVNGGYFGELKCDTCDETGEITPQQMALIEIGTAIKKYRLSTNAHQTRREVAKALGVTLSEYCQIERLGTATTEAGRKALSRLLAESGAAT